MEDGIHSFIGVDGQKYRAHIVGGKLHQITQRIYQKGSRPWTSWWVNKNIWHPGAHHGKLSKKARAILPSQYLSLVDCEVAGERNK